MLMLVLVIGFVLQLVLIDALFRLHTRVDISNGRLLTGLSKCMNNCQGVQK